MRGIPTIETYNMPLKVELPKNIVDWEIDPSRAVLLIHDMQRYFIKPLSAGNPKAALINNIILLRNYCRTENIPVAYTQQPGSMTETQRGLLKDFWGPGMKADAYDREIIDELTPESHNWIFIKWRYSAFYQSDLLNKMRNAGRDQLIICGVYAHIGILATAIEAFSNDIQVFLVADALGDFSKAKHLLALNYAAQCCAAILPTDKVISS